jgi:ribose 5-phosphate isomerase A
VTTQDDEKRLAAHAAAEVVSDGMTVGLGTGSTVAHLLDALAARSLDIRCVSTSVATEETARRLGIRTESFDRVDRFDVAIDGADQVSPDFWLVKGGGAAHTREKVVAASADRFVVIVDASKLVESITAPIPIELLEYGYASTVRRLVAHLDGPVERRDVPLSPDGGVIVDFTGRVGSPGDLAAAISATPGVVEHGLFGPELVSAVVVADGTDVRWLDASG